VDFICSEDVCRTLSLERQIMDVLNRAIAMSRSLIFIWVGLVVAAYMLRLYCVSTIQTQSPKLYEFLGKPAYVSRYSWAFLRKASKHPEFKELTVRARTALRVARVLDVILTTLAILLVILALRATFAH
jgi:hypothetical protein